MSSTYIVDPANVEYVLKTNFANYGKGLHLHSILSDLFVNGIFSVDGEKWRHQRKALSFHFSTTVLRDLSSEIFKINAVKLASIIYEAAICKKAIDIQDLFMKSSLDSIVKVLLGIDADTMCGKNNIHKEVVQFSNAFGRASEASIYRVGDFFWKIKRFLNIGREAVLTNNIKVVDQYLYRLIENKIETAHDSEDELSLKKRDFISKLLETRGNDPKYLRDMVLTLIVAGKDTTATALSWFLYMMCKHPHVQQKIAVEVREATKLYNNSSVDELAANLSDEVLKEMHYLQAALTETLRLYPVVSMDARICFSDDTLPDGFHVKKGEMVVYLPYAMGRMKFMWGNDAEEFRPERWLDKNGIFQEESPFKFTAFNGGPRICPGKDYSYVKMKIFSSVLLYTYVFKMSDDEKVVNYKTTINLRIRGGIYVHASPRLDHTRQLF